jgi:hypothetical protein
VASPTEDPSRRSRSWISWLVANPSTADTTPRISLRCLVWRCGPDPGSLRCQLVLVIVITVGRVPVSVVDVVEMAGMDHGPVAAVHAMDVGV